MSTGPITSQAEFDTLQRALRTGSAVDAAYPAYLHKAELHWNGRAIYSRIDIIRHWQCQSARQRATGTVDAMLCGHLDAQSDGWVYWRALTQETTGTSLHMALSHVRGGRIAAEYQFTGSQQITAAEREINSPTRLPNLGVTAIDFTGQRAPRDTSIPANCGHADLLRAWTGAWNRGSVAGLAALYGDRVSVAQPDGTLLDSGAAVAEAYQRYWLALSGGRMHLRHVLSKQNSAVALWSYRGRHLGAGLERDPSGVQLHLEGISEFSVESGRIAAEHTPFCIDDLADQIDAARKHPLQ